MKLLKLVCPSCGAKLEVNSNLEKFTCNYCGVTSLLDEESITVKNINSKLSNCINELKEYFDNGNYQKCYDLANKYLIEYPNNKKIKKYIDNLEEYISKIFASNMLKKYEHWKTKSFSLQELGADYNKIKYYRDNYESETIEKAYTILYQLKKGYHNAMIILVIGLLSILFLPFVFTGCTK